MIGRSFLPSGAAVLATGMLARAALAGAVVAAGIAEARPGPEPVLLRGVGELRVGLPAETLRRRFGATVADEHPDPACAYWKTRRYPDLSLMVVGGRLVRIDVRSGARRTRSGVGIGSTEKAVRAAYGPKLRTRLHPYSHPDGKYLVYRAAGEPVGLIFETLHGRVESMRVGFREDGQWIEGCS